MLLIIVYMPAISPVQGACWLIIAPKVDYVLSLYVTTWQTDDLLSPTSRSALALCLWVAFHAVLILARSLLFAQMSAS